MYTKNFCILLHWIISELGPGIVSNLFAECFISVVSTHQS